MLGNIAGLHGQQQIQQQQGQQQQQQQVNPAPPPPPPLNGQDLNLSNILHFLQSEWRRYERERNEWEIERAEMRVWLLLTRHYLEYAFEFICPLFLGSDSPTGRRKTFF